MWSNDSNYLEFVFEVDDTGKGIPKEKQISVFENYVQVKETALGEGGTKLRTWYCCTFDAWRNTNCGQGDWGTRDMLQV